MRQKVFEVWLLQSAFRSFTGGKEENVRKLYGGTNLFNIQVAAISCDLLDPACSMITQVIIS